MDIDVHLNYGAPVFYVKNVYLQLKKVGRVGWGMVGWGGGGCSFSWVVLKPKPWWRPLLLGGPKTKTLVAAPFLGWS